MEEQNKGLPSTRFVTKRVRVSTAPQAKGQRGAAARKAWVLAQRDLREPITVRMTYRGGPEAWVLVQYRGTQRVFPGWMQLCDLMQVMTASHGVSRGAPGS